MAPSVDSIPAPVEQVDIKSKNETQTSRQPLQLKGALDQFKSFDVTPIIGREFVDVNLAEWLHAENSDDLIRDLAITISQRGVVFFRAQNDVDNDLQKELVQRLGQLSGKPSTSSLHIHPITNAGRRAGIIKDDEISTISTAQTKIIFADRFAEIGKNKKQSFKDAWHSDIAFEKVPSDYALLRLTHLPKTGGDTMWASGYEVYDRISAPYQKFLEGLTATYAEPGFKEGAKRGGFELYTDPRGAPENIGDDLYAVHPVIRTNPVTGWKSVYAAGHHVQNINGLTREESEHLKEWFLKLIMENFDLQLRFKWNNPNDLAIWDNRSVYHAANADYIGLNLGNRSGQRAVSLGERPYLDPNSTGRREALAHTFGPN